MKLTVLRLLAALAVVAVAIAALMGRNPARPRLSWPPDRATSGTCRRPSPGTWNACAGHSRARRRVRRSRRSRGREVHGARLSGPGRAAGTPGGGARGRRRDPPAGIRPRRWRQLGGVRSERSALSVQRAPQFLQLRAERIRRGRPHHRARDRSELRATGTAASGCSRRAAASGGPKNALDGQPNWKFLSATFGIQLGQLDRRSIPTTRRGNTLYVGTGEANASGDSAAGVGLYKSTDGGDTWTGPLGAAEFNGRAIGSIAVKPGDPNTIYAATTRGVLGHLVGERRRRVARSRARRSGGCTSRRTAARRGRFIHNGSTTTAACTR